jgi:hypothetical protein
MVRCIGAYIGLACSQRPRLVPAPVAPRVLAPHDLLQMCKYLMLIKMQCNGCKE